LPNKALPKKILPGCLYLHHGTSHKIFLSFRPAVADSTRMVSAIEIAKLTMSINMRK